MAQIVEETERGFIVQLDSGKEIEIFPDEFDYSDPYVGDEVVVSKDRGGYLHVNLRDSEPYSSDEDRSVQITSKGYYDFDRQVAEFNGINGYIRLEGENLIINHTGTLMALGMAGEKVIPLQSIASVNFKRGVGMVTAGYIQISVPGSITRNVFNGGIGSDENAITFYGKYNDEAQKFRDYLQDCIDELKNPSYQTSNETDDLQQLRELKNLLDDGVITEEEFAFEKRKILGI